MLIPQWQSAKDLPYICPNKTSKRNSAIRPLQRDLRNYTPSSKMAWTHTRNVPRAALKWTPPWKRKQGRPKITWQRMVEAQLLVSQLAAKGCDRWRNIINTLCPKRGKEDKLVCEPPGQYPEINLLDGIFWVPCEEKCRLFTQQNLVNSGDF